MKKILFLDLDGTLLTRQKNIRKKHLIALKKFVDAGNEIIFTTGRNKWTAKKYINKVNEFAKCSAKHVILLKGAEILDISTDEVIKNFIPDAISKKIIEFCELNKVGIWMYTKFSDLKNVLFTTKRVKRTYIHLKLFMKMKIVDFTNPINALKINLVFLSQKKKQLFLDFIAKNNISQKLDLAIHKNLIEITNVNVNKGFSVQTILEKEEYKNSQTAAIGDSDNDIPMFKKVNLSFSISKKDSIKKQSLINFKKQKNAIDAAILNYLVPDAK